MYQRETRVIGHHFNREIELTAPIRSFLLHIEPNPTFGGGSEFRFMFPTSIEGASIVAWNTQPENLA